VEFGIDEINALLADLHSCLANEENQHDISKGDQKTRYLRYKHITDISLIY
jgi:hypothetical protein